MEAFDISARDSVSDVASEVVKHGSGVPESLAPDLREDKMNVGNGKADRPQGEEAFHAAAAGRFNPRRQNGGDQIDAEQHVDEPEVPDICAEVHRYFEDILQRSLQGGRALPVE